MRTMLMFHMTQVIMTMKDPKFAEHFSNYLKYDDVTIETQQGVTSSSQFAQFCSRIWRLPDSYVGNENLRDWTKTWNNLIVSM